MGIAKRALAATSAVGVACIIVAAPALADSLPAASSVAGSPGAFLYSDGTQVGPAIAVTPEQAASDQAPDNPSGEAGYFVYAGGTQLDPSESGFTSAAASPDTTVCVDNTYNEPIDFGAVTMYAKVDCTSRSSVSNVRLTLWQRPNTSSGWTSTAVRTPAGGWTPYTSQSYRVPCHAGYQMHTEFQADVITPDGAGPETWNSGNKNCT